MKLLAAKDVYEPAEDSFLLLDALESDSANLINFKPRIVLEVGPGSGIIISAIASFLKNSVYCLAADINPDACVVSKKTAELNDVNVRYFQYSKQCNFIFKLLFMKPVKFNRIRNNVSI